MAFPASRPRRLRRSTLLRRMVRRTAVSIDDLILPLFVHDRDPAATEEIDAMPGVLRWGLDRLPEALDQVQEAGISSVILFGLPETKSPQGESAWEEDGIFARAIRRTKAHAPHLVTISDVCFCSFTEHGHCGVWHDHSPQRPAPGGLGPLGSWGQLDNDATLEHLGRQAVAHARAGVDMVAPSDMTDGKIGAMRQALDAAGFADLPIMSYAAKFASAYYGPFRVAADNKPGAGGDRKSYQMDPSNRDEALRECRLDAEEGADILMVKPALAYLDVIAEVRRTLDLPVAAYNVSGEYAMVEAAAARGWIDHDRVMMETLLSIKRAGADLILTYHALQAAPLIRAGWEP